MRRVTLERGRELAQVDAALASAAGGAGRLLVVEGPPGIGKTHLVEAARARAKALGFARMKATGDEGEQVLPWGVIRQLVERSILRYSGETRAAILAGPAGRALAALDEALARGHADDAAVGRTLHALWWVAADLSADRPLLITVDDVQWADGSSQRFLAYLSRRLEDLSVLLVIGTRPPDPGDRGPLAELCSGRTGERLLPAPLSPAAVGELAEGAHPDVAAALHDASGGNPFFTEQLVAELERSGRAVDDARTAVAIGALGPRTVSRSLTGRLSPEASGLAAAVAVLGARADRTLAHALAGLEADAGHAAAEELVAAHVLDAAGTGFTHSVVREAVLADLDPGRRGRLHAEAARRQLAAGATAEQVGGHLLAATAGTVEGAGPLLHEAGRAALAKGDARGAVRLLRRAALEALGDDVVEADLGGALLRAGSPEEAGPLLRAAAAAAPEDGLRAERLARAAEATAAAHGPVRAIDELDGVLSTWSGDEGSRMVLEAERALHASFLFEGARGSGRRLARFAGVEGRTGPERMLLGLLVQYAFNRGRPASEVAALARRALRDGALAEDPRGRLVWGTTVYAATCAGCLEDAEAEIRRARAAQLPEGAPEDFVLVSTVAQQLAWATGDLRRAEDEGSAAIAAARLAERGPALDGMRAVVVRTAVLVAIERGDVDAAASLLAEEDALAKARTVPVQRLGIARAAIALAREDPAGARAEALALGEAEERAGAANATVPWRRYAALAAQRLGEDDEARMLVEAELAACRAWGFPPDVAEALRTVARLDPDRRIPLLEEAVALARTASRAHLVEAHALHDLGAALRAARRRDEARAALAAAADGAEACAARALHARALDDLAALGDRRRRLQFSGLEALTPGERRVAELAAGGRSNREIAQELFVSPKTVENQLGRTYVKLGIGGRRELGAVVAAA